MNLLANEQIMIHMPKGQKENKKKVTMLAFGLTKKVNHHPHHEQVRMKLLLIKDTKLIKPLIH